MVKSVYIHIPFCKQKCKYCSFVSYSCLNKIQEYLLKLLEEIDSCYKGEKINTLYFGGGTPSLLTANQIKQIINKFNINNDCEITIELNPDDINFIYLQELYTIGINRLSIGSQTFDNNILKTIGRRHNSEQILTAVKVAQKVGFKNISVDLIYGLPTQTLDILQKDLDCITSLGVQHISTYGLKIEEDSFWGKHYPQNLPDDDSQADMYLLINNYLERRGYNRYEISNFAQKGFSSRHNLNYWNNEEYYGFGVSAHGYVNNIRYSNFSTLDKYLYSPIKRENEHKQTTEEKLEEEIFLGFRKEAGINLKRIEQKFGIDFSDKYKSILDKYIPQYIKKTPQGYCLTLEGVLLSNNILSEFLN